MTFYTRIYCVASRGEKCEHLPRFAVASTSEDGRLPGREFFAFLCIFAPPRAGKSDLTALQWRAEIDAVYRSTTDFARNSGWTQL